MFFRRRPATPSLLPDDPWAVLRQGGHSAVADMLDEDLRAGMLTDLDVAGIEHVLRGAADDPDRLRSVAARLAADPGAFAHESGQRSYPAALRCADHDVRRGAVSLGRVAKHPGNPLSTHGTPYWLTLPHLTTSVLVIGPPGAGKTRGFARPIVESLALATLTGRACVVVVDVKGDDFTPRGAADGFDVTIDLANPASGHRFDLYGSAADPAEAADRLAAALLPDVSADKRYFRDAAKNALYGALAPFHAAVDRYPTVRELLALINPGGPDDRLLQSLRDRLRHRGRLAEHERLLGSRARQRAGRVDPAASLYEIVGLLDRPNIVELLDGRGPRFAMRDINEPRRVRIALAEGSHDEASRVLARLAVAQFVQTISRRPEGTGVLSVLVLDEAGRYVDDYVARGLQRLRSRNAGLVLLTQSLADLPIDQRDTILGAVGGKAVFGGVGPADARWFADHFGTEWRPETALTVGTGSTESHTAPAFSGRSYLPARRSSAGQERHSLTTQRVERYRWSPSDIGGLATGHALVSLTGPDGERTGCQLVNLRAAGMA